MSCDFVTREQLQPSEGERKLQNYQRETVARLAAHKARQQAQKNAARMQRIFFFSLLAFDIALAVYDCAKVIQ